MTTTMINLTPGKIQMNNMNILWTQNDHFVFKIQSLCYLLFVNKMFSTNINYTSSVLVLTLSRYIND